MNRNYMIALLAEKLERWKEYLRRPATAQPLSFLGADAAWSECKRAVVDLEIAKLEPVERKPEQVSAPRARRSEAQNMRELGY